MLMRTLRTQVKWIMISVIVVFVLTMTKIGANVLVRDL